MIHRNPVRMTSRVATFTAAITLAMAASAAVSVAAAIPAEAADRSPVQWRYVGTFNNPLQCNSVGRGLMLFARAWDYRCLDSRMGSALYVLSGPSF